ncbi:hypothetical protein QJS04_geneDACA018027 [Acorus gramineus]|uniref:HRDC domain-containing protein n=1 Tax=Acorus gramineus TaxID=55184 RepID=A0AAV9AAB6_ACOGR|nr:hypothetical protein QJS04_geneDACA018027 [Acorus gramineus]
MEIKSETNVAITIASMAALVVATSLLLLLRRRRTPSNRRCSAEHDKKPQNRFKSVLADNSYSPFVHLNRCDEDGKSSETSMKPHPYRDEIASLLENLVIPTRFASDDECGEMEGSCVLVETVSELEALAQALSGESVFAVDTEQHGLRSFLGFTALMQISTQKDDFLVDTIALHDEMAVLQPVFANPSICKVFHGAGNDVLWLQRDFHVYVVNLFDTAKACEVLSKPRKSLAYLLETYCGITPNKALQRADWRMRPLSKEMVHYARTDAHYLLYIADRLSRELKELTFEDSACPDDRFNFVLEASHRSNMICMQLYAKEIEATPGEAAASLILQRYVNSERSTSCNCSETEELVRRLCTWRDLMARMHDESLLFVLSNQAIVALATAIPNTPSEIYDIISRADQNIDTHIPPLPSPSTIVTSHVKDLLYLFQEVTGNPNYMSQTYVQMQLDSVKSCPISIYNYHLLSEFNLKLSCVSVSKQNGGKQTKPTGKRASRELFVQKFSCKSPVYHNCRIYASDGRLLCYCDRRKLEWYLRRDIAKLVENDPPAIMLLFEPKGRPEDEDNDFYIQSKKNMCVGCGERNHYLRYRIIPSCYRMHFPEHLKSHRSHDIVLLCVDCHEIAHTAAEKYKRKIAAEFAIPLFVRKVVDPGENKILNGSLLTHEYEEKGVSPLQLRTAAMALLRHGSKMPSNRHEELTLIVREYFGGREILQEDLEAALLVGMSPQEKRRLEKKRGLSFRHIKESTVRISEDGNNSINTLTFSERVDIDVNMKDSKNTSQESEHWIASEEKLLEGNNSFETNRSVDCDINDDDLLLDGDKEKLLDDGDVLRSNDIRSRGTSDRPGDSNYLSTNSSKYSQKLSLLGHGPHGKKVVERLLNDNGEDGICQFCQRWRQVFVEAIHPRFLPAGWDIMHSGRREFGKFSVYNPANKALDAEKVQPL